MHWFWRVVIAAGCAGPAIFALGSIVRNRLPNAECAHTRPAPLKAVYRVLTIAWSSGPAGRTMHRGSRLRCPHK